ncbi:major intrinsic protein [Reticulomyxa filosa]|uniref:Major intrinsic protein n=1 Tax=Reticulomyxa filosa TaxID=46433 RepID=X6NN93_RETFI|nr:major intrinsic protein [Reticulomyxa filosa]|eukprot:ETO27383.1 major intrinsic protein [Reticulomyxa filosa]
MGYGSHPYASNLTKKNNKKKGLVLMNMVYSLGHISGAHFNPAVTTAILVRNIPQFPRHDMFNIFGYFISQYAGGITGGFLAWSIGGHKTAYQWPHVQKDQGNPATPGDVWHVFQSEFIFTFLLAFIVLNVATDQRNSNNQFYGAAIGSTLMLAAFTIGSISGCVINPAVWVGTVCSASAAANNKHQPFFVYHFYIFWIAEYAGGAFAGLLFNLFIKNSQADGKAAESEKFEIAEVPTEDFAKTETEMR